MTRWIHYTPLDSVASSVGSPATAAANVHWSLHRAALVAWLKSISHLLQLPDSCVIASHSTWNNIFFFSAAATSPGHCTGSHWRRCRRCRWWCRGPAQAPARWPALAVRDAARYILLWRCHTVNTQDTTQLDRTKHPEPRQTVHHQHRGEEGALTLFYWINCIDIVVKMNQLFQFTYICCCHIFPFICNIYF